PANATSATWSMPCDGSMTRPPRRMRSNVMGALSHGGAVSAIGVRAVEAARAGGDGHASTGIVSLLYPRCYHCFGATKDAIQLFDIPRHSPFWKHRFQTELQSRWLTGRDFSSAPLFVRRHRMGHWPTTDSQVATLAFRLFITPI